MWLDLSSPKSNQTMTKKRNTRKSSVECKTSLSTRVNREGSPEKLKRTWTEFPAGIHISKEITPYQSWDYIFFFSFYFSSQDRDWLNFVLKKKYINIYTGSTTFIAIKVYHSLLWYAHSFPFVRGSNNTPNDLLYFLSYFPMNPYVSCRLGWLVGQS